jgi:hypothetical protein
VTPDEELPELLEDPEELLDVELDDPLDEDEPELLLELELLLGSVAVPTTGALTPGIVTVTVCAGMVTVTV